MTTPAPPTRRTRVLVAVVVVLVFAVGLFFGIRALVEAAGAASSPTPTPSATATGAGFSYTSDEYGYSVEFPSEPIEQSKTVPVGDFQVALTSAIWSDGTRSLISNGATYPAGLLTDVSASLRSSLTSAVAGIKGARLVSSDPTTIDGVPGISANILVPSGTLRIIIAIDGDTQYQLVAQNAGPEIAQGFFTSFRKL
ncbi:MAG: hypothetical protein ACTHKX_01560 [Pseudolysinimonas sp.]